jgi:hypothetical protein
MSIASLPFVAGDVSLEEAVRELRASRQSGLIVVNDDQAVLFEASDLHAQLAERASDLIKDIAGGTPIPNESAAPAGAPAAPVGAATEAVFVRAEAGRAVVNFFSDGLYARVASRMYYCELDDDHYYTAKEVTKLKPILGGWECDQGDYGLVKK